MFSFLSRQIDILFVYFPYYGLCVHSNLYCGMKDDIGNINSIYTMLLKMPCSYTTAITTLCLLLTVRWKFNTIETKVKHIHTVKFALEDHVIKHIIIVKWKYKWKRYDTLNEFIFHSLTLPVLLKIERKEKCDKTLPTKNVDIFFTNEYTLIVDVISLQFFYFSCASHHSLHQLLPQQWIFFFLSTPMTIDWVKHN